MLLMRATATATVKWITGLGSAVNTEMLRLRGCPLVVLMWAARATPSEWTRCLGSAVFANDLLAHCVSRWFGLV